ncbi:MULTISPECIES: hypothetical protein [unclassified Xanthobacter]|uniref:hypothetical protein n=1 Tax=unclassified Xanthobacter TaxID=2623496 RepID=UPI001F1B4E00|nr:MULTISPECIES: hypothetical protein [unclassified Xanthobacter]
MVATSKTIPDLLGSLVDSADGVAVSLAAMMGAVGLAMAGFALLKIYHSVQNDEDKPLGWIVALVCGSLLSVSGVIAARSSMLFFG